MRSLDSVSFFVNKKFSARVNSIISEEATPLPVIEGVTVCWCVVFSSKLIKANRKGVLRLLRSKIQQLTGVYEDSID